MSQKTAQQELFSAKDLVVVVTGGGSGLGRVIAHSLVDASAKKVYILGRREEALAVTQRLSSRPDIIVPITCDITSKKSLENAVQRISQETGYINLLIANAAMAEMRTSLLDTSSISALQAGLWEREYTSYESLFRTNTMGSFDTAIALLDLLDKGNKSRTVAQKSQIIFTSSSTGTTNASFGVFGYPVSKAGLNFMARQLSGMLIPFRIRVNTVIAGYFLSEMTEGVLSSLGSMDPTQEGSIHQDSIPLERVGNESDVAGAFLFLASRAGSYLSGVHLTTDGGLRAIAPRWALPQPGFAALPTASL